MEEGSKAVSIYRFPAIAGYKEFTQDEQFHKIVEEIKEVKYEKYKLSTAQHYPDLDIKIVEELFESLGMELLDVIHACETMLRMNFTDQEVEELAAKVREKNARRGYYEVTK